MKPIYGVLGLDLLNSNVTTETCLRWDFKEESLITPAHQAEQI